MRSLSLIEAFGWDLLSIGCVERGDFSRTCKQAEDSKVDFAVDITVRPL